ncbi:MAG: hypothetical protein GY775_00085 [Candidatus Scalindua sp.]|nr:hypothetical protein [Candidatus Scalindua sp.]
MWINTDPVDVSKGKLQNVSINSHGKFTLSPDKSRINKIPATYVWCLVADGVDSLFAGTGNPGSIFKVSHDGNVVEYFKTPELHVQSLVVDSAGNIYAGTLPHGRIYRITSKGKGEMFCELPVPYIWDMVSDKEGNLYAATGDKGIIYKISDKGTTSILFDSPSSNILDLVIDDIGNIYASCEPDGVIYMITPNGDASVLYDTDEDEIHCLALDNKGILYAGTSSGMPPVLRTPVPSAQPEAPQPPLIENFHGESTDVWMNDFLSKNDIEAATPQLMNNGSAENKVREVPMIPEMNTIYRIDKDRRARRIFAAEGLILCMSINDNNEILVGTGNKAALYKINSNYEAILLHEFSESQILDILSYKDGKNYMATGNNANVYQLSNMYSHEGTYESVVHDTTYVSSWGCISWKGETPSQTNIKLSTRSGNSRKPDNTWSDWVTEYHSKGEKIESPSARFIQYRATLTTDNTGITPSLDNVSIAYLPQNQPPIIRRVEVVTPKGVATNKTNNNNSANAQQNPIYSPDDMYLNSSRENNKSARKDTTKLISWEAEDPNNDRLEFHLEYKSVDESKWKILKRDIKEVSEFYWNINRIPDGYYQAKVIASDEPDNPLEFALREEIESDSFLIDNTRPVILNLKTIIESDAIDNHGRPSYTVIVSGSAKDEMCNITDIQYSMDSGKWQNAFPEDRIFDSTEETFRLTIPYISSDEHTIVINALDYEGNTGSSRIVFNP